MIRNRNMAREAKSRFLRGYFDISSTTPLFQLELHMENDAQIRRIDLVYAVATDAGTRPESIQVGTPSSPTLYANVTPAASTAINTVTSITPSSTALLPKGTALLMTRSANVGGTNTGEVCLVVHYDLIDRAGASRP